MFKEFDRLVIVALIWIHISEGHRKWSTWKGTKEKLTATTGVRIVHYKNKNIL